MSSHQAHIYILSKKLNKRRNVQANKHFTSTVVLWLCVFVIFSKKTHS